MLSTNQKGFGPVWLIALVAITATAILGYFIFQSNSEDTGSTASQESSNVQPNENPINDPDETNQSSGIEITTGDSQFGSILFDGNNQAIYIWEVEKTSTAECYDDCADAWPPVLTDGAPFASGGVNGDLLGTTKRSDGTTQVTYNGHPLYYYAHEDPGEVKCHNISTHGGLWWVIQPNGVRAE